MAVGLDGHMGKERCRHGWLCCF